MAVRPDGFDDPAALLWIVMLGVQCLPYAATFVTAAISALLETPSEPPQRQTLPAENSTSQLAKAA